MSGPVRLELTHDEALVLCEFLAQFDEFAGLVAQVAALHAESGGDDLVHALLSQGRARVRSVRPRQ